MLFPFRPHRSGGVTSARSAYVLLTFCTVIPTASQQVAGMPTDILINAAGIALSPKQQAHLPSVAPKALMRREDSVDPHGVPQTEIVEPAGRPVVISPRPTLPSGRSSLEKVARIL